MSQNASSLVSSQWLHERLADPSIRVVDIRGVVRAVDAGQGRQIATYEGLEAEYLDGHIPGSVFINWTIDIVDPDAAVKVQIAPPDRFAQLMGKLGINNDTLVVAVDGTGGHHATRLWWALRYYGHHRVAVLDGGMAHWLAGGYPVERGPVEVKPTHFTARANPGLVSDVDDVVALIESHDRQLVDARDAATFNGDVQRAPRGGHIPGAVNLPSGRFLASDGTWKSPADIRAAALEAGVNPEAPVTAYCNGGVTATAVLFGLHLAGLSDISNYDGSWNEWGSRADLPVESNQDL